MRFVCFTNHRFCVSSFSCVYASEKSKCRINSGMSLEISSSEMFRPIQVRLPTTNWCGGFDGQRDDERRGGKVGQKLREDLCFGSGGVMVYRQMTWLAYGNVVAIHL